MDIHSLRKVDVREVRQRFLIVCEGTNTEPNYFKSFHVSKYVPVTVQGTGINPTKILETAKKLQAADEYDQVWCVFDQDDWTPHDFNNTIKRTEQEGFKVAYSNQAFELWYVLHFEYLNIGISRDDYCSKLTKLFGKQYQKNSSNTYDELLNQQGTAIKHAENLLSQYNPWKPADDNPSTTVHLLVQELNRFIP